MFDTHGRKYIDPSINAVAGKLNKYNVSPKTITLIAVILGLCSAGFVLGDQPIIAVIILWLSGALDVVDGALARLSNKKSLTGALMDVVFDRVVEIGLIVSLGIMNPESTFSLMILSVCIIMSMTIFLTVGALVPKEGIKAFKYQGGFAERTEGFIFFTLMILLPTYLDYITFLFAAAVLVTAIFRFVDGYLVLRKIEK